METLPELEKQLAKAKSELEEIQKSIPAHSVRPFQLIQLEQAEEQVQHIKEKIEKHRSS